jgi:hypothetical protein
MGKGQPIRIPITLKLPMIDTGLGLRDLGYGITPDDGVENSTSQVPSETTKNLAFSVMLWYLAI